MPSALKTRVRRGLGWGFQLALVFILGDRIAVAWTVGDMFDPSPAGWLLIAVATTLEFLSGIVGGVVVVLFWPRVFEVFQRLRRAGWVAFFASVVVVGVVARGGHAPSNLSATPTSPTLDSRPSLLLVVVDTLRADALYGADHRFPRAPRIKQLATEGIFWSDVEAAAGWTLPSVASLMTGLYPADAALHRGLTDARMPPLAVRLRQHGYRTAALVDNVVLGRGNGYDAGFDQWFQRSAMRFAMHLPGFRWLPASALRVLRQNLPVAYYGCERLTAQAQSWIEAATPDTRPLLLYVHYMDPHRPYREHPQFGPAPSTTEPWPNPTRHLEALGPAKIRPALVAHLKHRYHNEVRAVDQCVGDLLEAWDRRRGGAVVLTADHGEEFLDHGELWHGHSLYRELVHVPLILRGPRQQPWFESRRIDHPVGLVDLTPTLLDYLGVATTADAGRDGVSWRPWLEGREPPPPVFLYSQQSKRGRSIRRLRRDSWVAIEVSNHSHPGLPPEALFARPDDPFEKRNRIHTHRAHYQNALKAMETLGRNAVAETSTDPASIQALRALGYIE